MEHYQSVCPARNTTRFAATLACCNDFWEHWGFEPWQRGPFSGVARVQRFVKDGFLGRIAEYRAWDRIVWQPGTPEEREALWNAAKPVPEVMTQRFLFLVHPPWTKRRIRSFVFGFRGFVEFYAYWPGEPPGAVSQKGGAEPRDLTELVDMALRLRGNESATSV